MGRGGETIDPERSATLQAYLLGSLDFDAALRLQRRLHYDVAGDRDRAVLLLCEHPPLLTVGRQGSRAHLRLDTTERALPLRWVNRGGGCILHMPGQLALYPILPLDRLHLSIPEYLGKLGEMIAGLLHDFSIRGAIQAVTGAVLIGNRPIAATGVAVRDWVSYYGAYLNVQPDLDPYRLVTCTAGQREPMTSLERERRGPVRPALVRERLLEHFARCFGFQNVVLFTDHPALQNGHRRFPPVSSHGLTR